MPSTLSTAADFTSRSACGSNRLGAFFFFAGWAVERDPDTG